MVEKSKKVSKSKMASKSKIVDASDVAILVNSATFIVQGHVTQADGSPLAGAMVFAVDQDLRGEEMLGQSTTGSDGHYKIQYTAAQFARAEKGTADLVVRVLNAAEAIIAASSTLFNAPQEATINLTVSSTAPGLLSEYERLVNEVTPLLVNVQPAGITKPTVIDRLADLKSADLDFLAGETGEARAQLEFLVASALLQKRALLQNQSIPAAAFYGLAREGLPIDLGALLAHTAQEQYDALAKAIEDNLIPKALSDTLEQIVRSIQHLVTQNALQSPPVVGTHSLGELFKAAQISGDHQTTLLLLSINHTGSPEEFWSNLRQQSGFQQPGVVDNLQLTMQLGMLTQNHLPLIQQLQRMDHLTSPRDLVKLDRATWTNLVNSAGVPPDVPGATPQEQTANYVNGIVSTLQAAFPTAAIAQVAATAPDFPAQPAVMQFFANSPDFDIRVSHVDSYAESHAATAFNGMADADKSTVVEQVKRLQRVFQLSTSADTMSALLNLGLDSAHAVANMPRRTFLAQYASALGGVQTAAMIHERGQFLNARNVHLYAYINDALHGAMTAAIGDDSAPIREDLIKRFPNYTELFGSLDLCDCKECRSVLSPAAYLVDLLEFLRNSGKNDAGSTPLDVLLGRRPDLQYLPLTCENTNTPLPYVDLVNEVLESYIALGMKLDDTTAHDTGDATSQELDANPQFTYEKAYGTLAGAVYPFTLPFNQPVAVARAYLENLGTSRYEVIRDFQKDQTAPLAVRGSGSEYLGITAEEYQILTEANFDPSVPFTPRPLNEYYGYEASVSDWEHRVAAVPEFLQQTGIAYVDLIEPVKTHFINPYYPDGTDLAIFNSMPFNYGTLKALAPEFTSLSPDQQKALADAGLGGLKPADLNAWWNRNPNLGQIVVLYAPDSACDLSVTRLQHLDGTDLTDHDQSFRKLHRFIRLWRKLGWSIADLDRALAALGATDITPDILTKLAQIKQLQNDLNVSNLQILLSLWADIDTRGNDSLYKKLFLSKAALNIDSVFTPNPDGSVLSSTVLIKDHHPALLAALRVSAVDLALILADAGLDVDIAPLTLPSVSALYRYAALSRMLKLRIPDLIALKTLSGINPFAVPDQTILFKTIFGSVHQSGFKVAHLNYLYRHLTAPPANLAPQPTTLLLLAETLRDGLTKITQDNTLAPDPTGDLTRTKLAVLFDSATVDQAIGMINGTEVYAAPLGTLPDELAKKDASHAVLGIDPSKIPALAGKKLTYDPTAKVLRFQGAMTTAEQTELVDVAADATYQAAVNNLFQQPETFIQNAFSGFRVYAAPLVMLPDAIAKKDASGKVLGIDSSKLPPVVANKVSYDPTAAMLRFLGAMSMEEQAALVKAASDTKYQDAVNNLFQQSLQDARKGFLDVNDAARNLLRDVPSLDQDLKLVLLILLDKDGKPTFDPGQAVTTAATSDPAQATATAIGVKFYYMLQRLLPYLVTQLSHAFIKQTVADALKLDGAMAQLLLETVLKSTADATRPAVTDLSALATPGLTAEYFTSIDTSGTLTTKRTDPTVAFDGNAATLPGGTQSARWSGMLLAPNNGDYTFTVRAGGTVQLWVGDDTAPLILTLDATTNEMVSLPVTLKAGTHCDLRLEVTAMAAPTPPHTSAVAELSWQSAALPKSIIPSANLYPSAEFDTFGATFTLLQKAALLVKTFQMTDKEVAYLSEHSADFDGFDLNALPLTRDASNAATIDKNAVALFKWWLRVNDYTMLRNSLPQGQVSLVDVFAAASASDSQTLPGLSTPGLTASYFTSKDLSGASAVRADRSVAFDGTGTTPATSIPAGTGSARWSGLLLAPNSGVFTFYVRADGAVQLWVDTDAVPLALTYNAGTNEWLSAPVTLKAGQLHDLRLEVTQITAPTPPHVSTVVELSWRSTFAEAVIPSDYLFTGVLATITESTGWDPQIIAGLVGTKGFNLAAADFKNGIWLVRLKESVRLIKRLGVSAAKLFAWADLGADFGGLENIAQEIKKAVQAKYDPETWPSVAKQLNDPLRESQRDALVAYLLPRMGLTYANQLFEYFLIDAEMGACMETSRVKQALSSVQLFVQRCLMNLESELDPVAGKEIGVPPSAIDADQWQWMKHYRVWEANRKVFLYPENWIEPELRDDKSPFFKELEGELLQNEVTTDTVETAFLNYLEKLDQVKRLEICGMYWQDKDPDTGEEVNILHVFGRTLQTPHLYYYRRLLKNSTWTPWEIVQVDIQGIEKDENNSSAGVHLMPVLWNRRLYLIWPIFTRKADKRVPKGEAPKYYWEIKLAWSEYKQKKWQPKQVSKDFLTSFYAFNVDYTFFMFADRHIFKAKVEGDELIVRVYVIDWLEGEFRFAACGDVISVGYRPNYSPFSQPDNPILKPLPFDFIISPDGMFTRCNTFAEGTAESDEHQLYGSLRLFDSRISDMPMPSAMPPTWVVQRTYLESTPTAFNLLYPHQYLQFALQAPFFYQDHQRTFFVTPTEGFTFSRKIANPDQVSVSQYAQLVSGGLTASTAPAIALSSAPASEHLLAARYTPSEARVSTPGDIAAVGSQQAVSDWASYVSASDSNWRPNPSAISHLSAARLKFDAHYHPYVCEFIKSLARHGIPGLLTEDNQTLGISCLHSPWENTSTIAEEGGGPACIIQGDFGVSGPFGYFAYFEAVVLEGTKLVHYTFDYSDPGHPWRRAEVISHDATGPGWLIQSDWVENGHGHLEVIVPEGNNLVHYWTDNTSPAHRWNKAPVITSRATGPGCLIQSDYIDHGHGSYQVVALEGSNLVRYWHDSNPGSAWHAEEMITSKATSPGCIIQSDYEDNNHHGRFEVVVCEGRDLAPPYDLVHYYFDGTVWHRSEVITSNATGAGCLIQSNTRDGAHGNFEVVVPEGNMLIHYWKDNSRPNLPWQQGQVITAKATGPACLVQSVGVLSSLETDKILDYDVAVLEGKRLVDYSHVSHRFEFLGEYQPTLSVNEPYPVEDVDFLYGGAYALYNWELFFHAPLLIATRLSKNQRFEDAQKWFHYIFNPTDDSPNEVPPARYWKVLPFKNTPRERIEDMMLRLDAGDPDLVKQVDAWRHHPFQPHLIARLRLSAYQKNVFMKYLDNLIAWGDQLFQQDTIETINEAEQLYVLAANLLGPRPQRLPARGAVASERYVDLKDILDKFSNALEKLENEFPFSSGVSSDPTSESGGLLGIGKTLYFCIPQNAKLLTDWDIVADRLFKIRHCMNIEGVVQQLPLFEPPIDPALLVQAAAQGVDLGSVLNDLNAPLPYYRFSYLLQKALEMCAEVRALGGAMLSALEKKDAEELALLRATHETTMLNLVKEVKKSQLSEAQATRDGLDKTWELTEHRRQFYADQLAENGSGLTVYEQEQQNQLGQAQGWQAAAQLTEAAAVLSHAMPQFMIGESGMASPVATALFGGQNMGNSIQAASHVLSYIASIHTYWANQASTQAGWERRSRDWKLQLDTAAKELEQIDKQKTAADIRITIASQEIDNHDKQIDQAQEIQDLLTNKYTNQDLYAWMLSDISATYFQCYQLAYELAKKAERAYRFERGLTNSNFIQFGYWDSLRKGLQSGERLYLALKQMERAYHDQNKREYEIAKHYSLMLNEPLALIALKETGQCEIELPETLFDADYPGHYMRRLKSVSLTIPCVVGPYTSINCTLTLLKNKTRIKSVPADTYTESEDGGDDRFVTDFAAMQSIATSHAQNDSGMFELNFHDERYLPFEGAGTISRWRIDLPMETNAFDFNTLSDVVLHLKYTAREGGDILRNAAKQNLKGLLSDTDNAPLARLFSLKHEFPTDWYRFLHPTDPSAMNQTLTMDLGYERFPFMYRGKTININAVELFMNFKNAGDNSKGDRLVVTLTPDNSSPPSKLAAETLLNGMPHLAPRDEAMSIPPSQPLSLAMAAIDIKDIADLVDDILVVCHYTVN